MKKNCLLNLMKDRLLAKVFLCLSCIPFCVYSISSTWTARAGNWNAIANWSAGIPNAIDDSAVFPALGGGTALNINLDVSPTVGTLSVTGGGLPYTFSAGTINLQVSSGNATLIHAGNFATYNNSFNLLSPTTFNVQSTMTISHGISGTGSLTKTGFGSATIQGVALTYGGTTTINQGFLGVRIVNGLPTTTDLTLSGGSLTLSVNQTIGSLSGTSNITLGSSVTLTVGNASSTVFSGIMSNTGGLTKVGASSMLTLSGVNTYTGPTTITGGILQAGIANALSSTTAVTVTDTFDLNNFNQNIGSLAGGGSVTLGNATLSCGNKNTDTTFSGVISDSGAGQLTKVGNGIFTLSNNNTYSGNTNINGGTIKISANNNLGNGNITFNGGTLQVTSDINTTKTITLNGPGILNVDSTKTLDCQGLISSGGSLTKTGQGTLILSVANSYAGATNISLGSLQANIINAVPALSAITVNGSAVFNLNNFDQNIGSLAGNGLVYLGGAQLSTGNDNSDTSFSGMISESGSLIKVGTGIFSLLANNTYSGSTTISSGTISVDTLNALPTATSLTLGGGSSQLTLNNSSQTLGSISGSGQIYLNGVTTPHLNVGSDGSSTSFTALAPNYVSGNGVLTKEGAGTFTLAGNNTYSGGTHIDDGILKISQASNLGMGEITFNGASLETTSSFSTNANITINSTGTFLVDALVTITCTGQISGNGSLIKDSTGTLVLTPAGGNNYLGDTTVDLGILRCGVVNALPLSTSLTVNDTFELNNFDQEVGCIKGGTLGYIDLGSATFTFGSNNCNDSYEGVIDGSGGIIKIGSGVISFSNNNSYTGLTTISNGTIKCLTSNAISSSSAVINNGTFDLNDFSQSIGSLAGDGSVPLGGNSFTTLTTGSDNTDTTFSGSISGAGNLTKIGNGIFTLSNNNSFSGATIIFGGTLKMGSLSALSSDSAVVNNGMFDLNDFSQSIGSLAGNGNVSLGLNPLTTLTLGNDGSSTNFTGIISGSGGITKVGAGDFTLSNNNTYTGPTTVSGGLLKMNITNALTSLTFVTVDANLELNDFSQNIGSLAGVGNVLIGANPLTTLTTGSDNTDSSFDGVIAGSGGLTKEGSGLFVLAGTNEFTGSTNINNGELRVTGVITSDTNISSLGTLSGNGLIHGNVVANGTISPGASIGTTHVIGDVTYNNGSLYEVELDPSSSDRIEIIGSLTINPGSGIEIMPDFGHGAYAPFKRYSIISTTGGVSGQFDNIIISYPQFFGEISYDNPFTVDLIVSIVPFGDLVTKGNPHRVASYLDSLLPLPEGSDLDNVVEALQFLTIPELIDAFDQMHPAIFKGNSLIQENNLVNLSSTIKDRICHLYNNSCSQELFVCKKIGVWLDPFYDNYIQKTTHGLVGFNSNSEGLALGLDYSFNKCNYLGLAFSYTFSDISWKQHRGDCSANNFYAGLYYTWLKNRIFINSSMLAGLNYFNGKRNIKFPGISRVAKNHHFGKDFSFHLDGGYKFNTKNMFNFLPFGALDFFYMKEDSFSEKNAQSLNLDVKDSNYYMLRGEVGANFNKCFFCENKLLADLKLSYVLETRQHGKHYFSNFIGFPGEFTVRGINYNRSIFSTGITLTSIFPVHSIVSSVKYNGEFGKKYINNSISIQLVKDF